MSKGEKKSETNLSDNRCAAFHFMPPWVHWPVTHHTFPSTVTALKQRCRFLQRGWRMETLRCGQGDAGVSEIVGAWIREYRCERVCLCACVCMCGLTCVKTVVQSDAILDAPRLFFFFLLLPLRLEVRLVVPRIALWVLLTFQGSSLYDLMHLICFSCKPCFLPWLVCFWLPRVCICLAGHQQHHRLLGDYT